ncbi:hypothetical protein CWB41_13875 [Methylovirgula ligni]|uniref:Uncharacterized protein n=1 Tax=Methylovirgula ligni TaxID=569860 RepID=A0A3D9YMS8_9HYPH|nr:hypothetical protein [Methylovirgula ligni]QAY96682.1 hypothetical protein CWB41_13875 [Methylovirgula ligni]REF83278.1 hypothetical protein DES32_3194 [Methylovirgula ligni]
MEWETNEGGDIILAPVQSFHVVPALGMSVLVKIGYLPDPALSDRLAGTHQFALTPQIARQLAADLLRGVEAAEQPPPAATPRN